MCNTSFIQRLIQRRKNTLNSQLTLNADVIDGSMIDGWIRLWIIFICFRCLDVWMAFNLYYYQHYKPMLVENKVQPATFPVLLFVWHLEPWLVDYLYLIMTPLPASKAVRPATCDCNSNFKLTYQVQSEKRSILLGTIYKRWNIAIY